MSKRSKKRRTALYLVLSVRTGRAIAYIGAPDAKRAIERVRLVHHFVRYAKGEPLTAQMARYEPRHAAKFTARFFSAHDAVDDCSGRSA
jgi:hypothetical protein